MLLRYAKLRIIYNCNVEKLIFHVNFLVSMPYEEALGAVS